MNGLDHFDFFVTMLMKNHKNVQKLVENILPECGLKHVSIMCIRLITVSESGLSASELGSIFVYDKALISRTLRDLQERGYICRNPEDEGLSRGYRMVLTEKGRELAENMSAAISELTAEVSADIPQSDIEVFYNTSVRLSENLVKYAKEIQKNAHENSAYTTDQLKQEV